MKNKIKMGMGNKTAQKFNITITHLYPDEMNLYGDIGNVISLSKRAEARGIKVTVKNSVTGEKLESRQTDIYFFGGGQDAQQVKIAADLMQNKKKALLKDLSEGVAMLSICGGYQLLGKFYLTPGGKKAEGVSFFPIETVAPDYNVQNRCIGNISTHLIDEKTIEEVTSAYEYDGVNFETLNTLVGFENHGGRTKLLDQSLKHLEKVINGNGDSVNGGYEGLRVNNAFGTYMHGPFLPKNPQMTDLLLYLALKRKYGNDFKSLQELNDEEEWAAHRAALRLKS